MRSSVYFLLLVILGCASAFDIREHLATKSPYISRNTTSTPVPNTCTPIHIDLVARHGSREPTSGDIKSLIQLAADFRKYSQYITNETFAWMKNWTNPYDLINQGFLSYSGELEHYHLAQRAAQIYPSLMSKDYYPNVYVFQSTQVPRTGVSASAYAFGFLEGKGGLGDEKFEPIFVSTDTKNQDVTLRFFDACQQYVSAMDNGTINSKESEKYVAKNYPDIAVNIAKRLGVYGIWNLTIDDVDTFFTACAFEVSVGSRTDQFCTIFTEDEVQMYEYAEDLDIYYTEGYGSELGYKISSPLLQNIVSGLDAIIKSGPSSVEMANLRFAHAETVLPFAALLGLFAGDKPLKAEATLEEVENRSWRSSIISPFAGNFMFVLYQCESDYKVKLLHNEEEFIIPGCDSVYCSYKEFKSQFSEALAFNFTRACAPPATNNNNKENSGGIKAWEFAFAIIGTAVVTAVLTIIAHRWYMKSKHAGPSYMSVSVDS